MKKNDIDDELKTNIDHNEDEEFDIFNDEDDIFGDNNSNIFDDEEEENISIFEDDTSQDNEDDMSQDDEDDMSQDDIFGEKTENENTNLKEKSEEFKINEKSIDSNNEKNNKNIDPINSEPNKDIKENNQKKDIDDNENKNSSGNNVKNLLIAMGLCIATSITSSFLIINMSGFNKNDLNEIKNKFGVFESNLTLLENQSKRVEATVENSELKKDNLNKQYNEVLDILNTSNKKIDNNINYIKILANSSKQSMQKIEEMEKFISSLPKTSVDLIKKLENLEKKMNDIGTLDKLDDEFTALKTEIQSQRKNIVAMENKLKKNSADIEKNKIANLEVKDKVLKNSQTIAENRKGIRNNTQKMNGEDSVKDLLKKVQDSNSKEVRAVTLLYDNNRKIEVEDNKKGYKIMGSIASEVFFVDNGTDEPSEYYIGDYLDGYGKIIKINHDGIIETENGFVRNLNKTE